MCVKGRGGGGRWGVEGASFHLVFTCPGKKEEKNRPCSSTLGYLYARCGKCTVRYGTVMCCTIPHRTVLYHTAS